jgi:hypothetical protein
VTVLSLPVNREERGFTPIKLSLEIKAVMRLKEIKLSYQDYVERRNLLALLTTSGMGLVVGGTMAKLWMATTAELARSGSLLVVTSSPYTASVD